MSSEEAKYEAINIWIRTPEEGSWFDRLFDLLTANCEDPPDPIPDDWECACGMQSMGGFTGTMDELYEHERLSERWADSVLADDLKTALTLIQHLTSLDVHETEWYQRLQEAAYWHDDFAEWLASVEGEEEEPEEFYMNGQLPAEDEGRWADDGGAL